ncbi:hypothetical protein [Paenibacillus koleovorans]|nr:hypothetical protein [Paenibacillus koleovorans]
MRPTLTYCFRVRAGRLCHSNRDGGIEIEELTREAHVVRDPKLGLVGALF